MDILLDGSVFEIPITGVATTALSLYKACRALQPALDIAVVHRRPLTCALPDGIHSCRWVPFLNKHRWRTYALPPFVALKHPRIVHFPWNGNIPRLWGNVRVVSTYHDVIPVMIPECYGYTAADLSTYRKRVQQDLDRSDLVFTVSDCSRRDIAKHFRLRTEPIVMHWAPAPEFSAPADAVSGDAYFIYIGGYDPRKGLELLVQVYDQLFRARKVAVQLVLTGTPTRYSSQLGEVITRAKESGAVVEAGYLDNQTLASKLRQAKGLIYPSYYEGFGLPVLEAMACQCPVITTDSSALPEICGEAALYFRSGDAEGLAQAVVELESNAGLRQQLRIRGAARVQRFSWEQAAATFLGALETLQRPPV